MNPRRSPWSASLAALLAATALAAPGLLGSHAWHSPQHQPTRTLHCTPPVVINGVTYRGDCYMVTAYSPAR